MATSESRSVHAKPLPDHYRQPWLHGGFWLRVGAWCVDLVVLSAAHWVVFLVLAGGSVFTAFGGAARVESFAHFRMVPFWLLFDIIVPWLYFALCESSRWQATPGKAAVGLQVTDLYGNRIGFARASGRYFGKYLSTLVFCFGFLLAGWTARKQALHDLLAGCCVVRRDGLLAWRDGAGSGGEAAIPRGGMPGWAVGLIVLACLFFVAVPVTAMLAAIAIPAYESYVVRSQVAEGVQLSARPRALIGQYIGQRGALPPDNAALGLPEPGAIATGYVASVRVSGGKVVVTYSHAAAQPLRGRHVVMSPVGDASLLHWQCSSPDLRARYLPASCRK